MKIALVQLNYHIGNFEQNTARIIEHIREAKKSGAELAVFAELCITGYPPRDFLEFDDFIERCNISVKEIAHECVGIAAVVGSPSVNTALKGKHLFNSAFFLNDGKIQAISHKALLPNYDVFDEYRYFEPGTLFDVVEFNGKKIALTICEDLWNVGDDLLYVMNPMDELAKHQPDLIINIAASPFHYSQAEMRKQVLSANAIKYKMPVVYVNHAGGHTELLFDGGSMVLNSRGLVVNELNYFREDFIVIDIEDAESKVGTAVSTEPVHPDVKTQRIHDALVMGIRNYFEKLGFSKAILGLSGGIDSAVTLVLAAEALGASNVHAVLLPSQYSSEHSIDDARQLAVNIGCPYDIIPIEEGYKSFEQLLKPYFEGLPFGLAEENLQARIRAVLLMAMSNKFGYILLNTSNKSEAAVGYGTLYGDMCGGISVLGDVYKTEVYDLAHYINRLSEVIPVNSIVKPPSAELRPGQKDSDSLPEYPILDTILFQYIEQRKGPSELVNMGFDEATVKRVLRLVNTNEYKRYQTPPILRVSPKAFGTGRRMPIVGKYLS
ncbi:MAG: NAD+ synthase [Bacteroidota bacterium]